MYVIMEFYFSIAFLTSLAVPASSQDKSMGSNHRLHSSTGNSQTC